MCTEMHSLCKQPHHSMKQCFCCRDAYRGSPFVFAFSNRCIQLCLRGLHAEGPRFNYRQGQQIFLYSTASRPALGPSQPPIQWVPVVFSPRVKRPGCMADHSFPPGAEVKNDAAIPTCTSHVPSSRATYHAIYISVHVDKIRCFRSAGAGL
jgi:hypothetical protein